MSIINKNSTYHFVKVAPYGSEGIQPVHGPDGEGSCYHQGEVSCIGASGDNACMGVAAIIDKETIVCSIPVRPKGGSSHSDNLHVLCKECNFGKGCRS